MASYEKRGNTWRYRISLGKDAKRANINIFQTQGFKRKSDAKHHAEMVERQLRTGDYIAPSTSTFKQVANDWLKQYANEVKVSSVRAREKAIHHAIERFNNKPIQTINKHDYQRFVNDISAQYSKNYIDSIIASTNMIFKYAYDMKLIRIMPSEGIKRPKKKVSVEELEDTEIHKKFLEKDELFQFLEIAKITIHHKIALKYFVHYIGMRAGELLALKWSDIDFENNTINITKTYYNPNNNKSNIKYLHQN